ncbi:hypothetical protein JY97_08245 [Alkalispirochaeta odontotermitis]|nr:hypothetical protein JY97_08245 [Alkalispirochaeta odontotermitis]CAB1073880.1 hypothetical protein D1AOALGA4SA_1987 [Olavius algarvensis Delta 1 endosymbiont]
MSFRRPFGTHIESTWDNTAQPSQFNDAVDKMLGGQELQKVGKKNFQTVRFLLLYHDSTASIIRPAQ